MAFATTQDDEKVNPLAPQTAQPTTSTGGPATSKTPTSNVSSQPAGLATPAQPFQNINAYLTANQPQTEQLGQTVAGGLNDKADKTQTALDTSKQSFESAVQAGSPTIDQSKIDTLKTAPSQFVQNPSDVATYKALTSATPYSGPDGFSTQPGYVDLSAAAHGAGALGKSLSDFNGIESYLQSLTPNSTQGQAVLDTTLLQGTPSAVAPVTAAAGRLNAIPGSLDTMAGQEDALAANAKTTTGNTSDALRAATQTGSESVGSRISGEASAAKDAATKTTQTAIADFIAGHPTADDLSALGLTPDSEKGLQDTMNEYGHDRTLLSGVGLPYSPDIDLSQFYQAGAPGADFADRAATTGDYADVSALRDLLGGAYNAPIGTDQSLAGTAPTNFITPSNHDPVTAANEALKGGDQAFLSYLNSNHGSIVPVLTPEQQSMMYSVFARNRDSLSPAQRTWFANYTKTSQPGGGPTGFGIL